LLHTPCFLSFGFTQDRELVERLLTQMDRHRATSPQLAKNRYKARLSRAILCEKSSRKGTEQQVG
jgi:hypothetical protein